jgi:hypothetical protein
LLRAFVPCFGPLCLASGLCASLRAFVPRFGPLCLASGLCALTSGMHRFGPASGLLWASFGPSLGLLQAFFAPPSNLLRVSFGSSSDLLRAFFGPPSDLLRVFFGSSSDLLRAFFGPHLDLLRAFFGPPSDLLRVFFGPDCFGPSLSLLSSSGLPGPFRAFLEPSLGFLRSFPLASGLPTAFVPSGLCAFFWYLYLLAFVLTFWSMA